MRDDGVAYRRIWLSMLIVKFPFKIVYHPRVNDEDMNACVTGARIVSKRDRTRGCFCMFPLTWLLDLASCTIKRSDLNIIHMVYDLNLNNEDSCSVYQGTSDHVAVFL